MKLSKDNIQKIALSTLMLLFILYGYFSFLLDPLAQKGAIARKEMADLRPKLLAAKKQLNETNALEEQAPASQATLETIFNDIPNGSPIAWFPPMMTDFFKNQGINSRSIRLTREADAGATLPKFRRLSWVIELSEVQYSQFGQALAALENKMPLIQIEQIQMMPSTSNVETQNVNMTLSNLVKK